MDASVKMKLQMLSDQKFYRSHHKLFSDVRFAEHLRRSIMEFSFRPAPENESPDQMRKRYTHTLS